MTNDKLSSPFVHRQLTSQCHQQKAIEHSKILAMQRTPIDSRTPRKPPPLPPKPNTPDAGSNARTGSLLRRKESPIQRPGYVPLGQRLSLRAPQHRLTTASHKHEVSQQDLDNPTAGIRNIHKIELEKTLGNVLKNQGVRPRPQKVIKNEDHESSNDDPLHVAPSSRIPELKESVAAIILEDSVPQTPSVTTSPKSTVQGMEDEGLPLFMARWNKYKHEDPSELPPPRIKKPSCFRDTEAPPRRQLVSMIEEEPLYHIYEEVATEEARQSVYQTHFSMQELRKSGHKFQEVGNSRTYWRQILPVKESGLLQRLSEKQIKTQEAIFEILTSEASYVKSLFVLTGFYLKTIESSIDGNWITREEFNILSQHIWPILEASEKFEKDMESVFDREPMLTGLIDVFQRFVEENFQYYVAYSRHYMDITKLLENLFTRNKNFKVMVEKLKDEPEAHKQPFQALLNLPIPRITRYPLLVSAVLAHMENDNPARAQWSAFHESLQKKARECDEEIKKVERRKEMMSLKEELSKPDHGVNIDIIGDESRYLLLRADVMQTMFSPGVMAFRREEVRHLFLFNDMLVIASPKNTKFIGRIVKYKPINCCKKSLVQASLYEHLDLVNPELAKLNPVLITLGYDYRGEESKLIISFNDDTTRQRWLDALKPEARSARQEVTYCKQVVVLEEYKAQRPDELTLCIGDVLNVVDNEFADSDWCQGERLRDGELNWFPLAYTKEIDDDEVKKTNLRMKESRNSK